MGTAVKLECTAYAQLECSQAKERIGMSHWWEAALYVRSKALIHLLRHTRSPGDGRSRSTSACNPHATRMQSACNQLMRSPGNGRGKAQPQLVRLVLVCFDAAADSPARRHPLVA